MRTLLRIKILVTMQMSALIRCPGRSGCSFSYCDCISQVFSDGGTARQGWRPGVEEIGLELCDHLKVLDQDDKLLAYYCPCWLDILQHCWWAGTEG